MLSKGYMATINFVRQLYTEKRGCYIYKQQLLAKDKITLMSNIEIVGNIVVYNVFHSDV